MISFYLLLLFLFLTRISLINSTYLYFERNSYELYLSESTPIYTKITLIKALSSSSLSIQYELHGDTNKTFYLNSLTGELILLHPVDYETISLYKLTIEAHSSSIIAPCFTELIIHIVNINDNPPEISLIIYPSVLYESNIIKYDLNLSSTPFATINIKDPDESTKSLSLSLNDTEHFQIQLIRQTQNDLIYILSTKNNAQLIQQDSSYDLLLISCDNDQPLLCTNQTYQFHLKSTEYLCNLSFKQKNYIIDIKEDLIAKTLLMHKITNKFCENIYYSIDNIEKFSIDSRTGDLFAITRFNRIEQSIHMIHLFINNQLTIKIFVRILDEYGKIPFLINKHLIINQKKFSFVHIFNSTFCRTQLLMENYFQLLSNCTIISIRKPPVGQYLFNIELVEQVNFQDTFLLELTDEEEEEQISSLTQSQWIIVIPIILSILIAIGIVFVAIIIIKQKQIKFNQLCPDKQNMSSLPINNKHEDDKSCYNKYAVFTNASKLKVHDDYELPPSTTSTPIYVIQKPSPPPLSSLSPPRDDEGYSGSSDVSENHLPFESTIISGNGLIEQYHVHEFPNHQSISPLYDVPRRYIDTRNGSSISPDVTLV